MRMCKIFLLLSTTCYAVTSSSEEWSFVNTSANYLDWSASTITRTNKGPFAQKKSFFYMEMEGGKGGDWGDLYGFVDIENPLNHANHFSDPRMNRRVASKGVARFKLTEVGDFPIMLYAHLYDFRDNHFFDQNRVLGLGTNLSCGKLWIHPFIGAHQEFKSMLGAHMNGGMAGYVLGYDFHAFGQAFTLSQWHETEFARQESYLHMADEGAVVNANSLGHNGALSLWWQLQPSISTGMSYRYALNKLGSAGFQSALIYTIKYHFK